jgi:hypothetical protein
MSCEDQKKVDETNGKQLNETQFKKDDNKNNEKQNLNEKTKIFVKGKGKQGFASMNVEKKREILQKAIEARQRNAKNKV